MNDKIIDSDYIKLDPKTGTEIRFRKQSTSNVLLCSSETNRFTLRSANSFCGNTKNIADTIKIKVPYWYIQDFDLDMFTLSSKDASDPSSAGSYKLKQDCKIPGLSYISIPFIVNDQGQREPSSLLIEMSAKILKDDYLFGFNIDTLRLALHYLTDVSFCPVLFEPDDLDTRDIEVLRFDIKADIKFMYDVTNALIAIAALKGAFETRKKVTVTQYTDPTNKGLEFKQVTSKETKYSKIYAKGIELQRAENRAFFGTLQDPDGLLSDTKSMLRFERKLYASSIRKLFEANNTLAEVFQSKINVPLKAYKELLGTVLLNQVTKGKNIMDKANTPNEVWDMLAAQALLDLYGNDPDRIAKYIEQSTSGVRNTRFRKKVRETLAKLVSEQTKESTGLNPLEILEYIKAELEKPAE